MAGSGTAHLRPGDPLLQVKNLVVEFPAGPRRRVHAVSDVSLDISEGETLGLVGESGCGKSTTGRAIMQLPPPTSGVVRLDGKDLTALSGEALRRTRPLMQLILQDPISSLNPRRRVADIVAEPLRIWQRGDPDQQRKKVAEAFDAVGLDVDAVGSRRPHEFSGGQCQRVSVARALVLEPKVLICDEPVSSLDVSVQAQILNLLEETKLRYSLTLLFITHDLSVVKNVSDRVAVMYLGKLCEIASSDDIYYEPSHPYTRALISSVPDTEASASGETAQLSGELPSPVDPPSGCRFRTRCPRAAQTCAETEPEIREIRPGHFVACHFPVEPVEFGPARRERAGATG